MNYKKPMLIVLIASILVGIFVFCTFFISQETMSRFDFTAYYNGAATISRGEGRNLYRLPGVSNGYKGDTFVIYKNPPVLALFFIPLTYLPVFLAYRIYVAICLVMLYLAVKLLWREYGDLNFYNIFFYTVAFVPGIISIITGQISIIFLIIWIYILRYFKIKKYFLLGLVAGLLGIKPQFLVFLPFLLLVIPERRKFLTGLGISFLVQLAVSFIAVGFSAMLNYPSFLVSGETQLYTSDPYSQISFSALLFNLSRKLIFIHGNEYLILFSTYLMALVFLALLKKKGEGQLFFHLFVLLTLFFVPHLWDYDLVLLLPTIFYLLQILQQIKMKKIRYKIIVSLCLLYFCWVLRFLNFSYLISLNFLLVSVFILSQQKTLILKLNKSKNYYSFFRVK